MNSKLAVKSEPRIDLSYLSTLGIKRYGHNNLYPNDCLKVVRNSATGDSCLGRYIKFIKGSGLYDPALSELVVNRKGDTLGDITGLLAYDIATFGGFAVHANYNVFGQIVELQHVPFENCRLCEADADGQVNRIAIHPDWTGKTTREGKRVSVSRENVDYIDVFLPDHGVVASQIEAAGGIENYKGQILYVSLFGRNVYPLTKYDDVLTEMVTDEGISDLKNRDVCSGFFPAGVFVVKKGQGVTIGDEDFDEQQEDSGDNEFVHNFQSMQGAKNAQRAMVYFIGEDDEVPQFVRIQGANYDKTFEATEKSVTERIYASFGQEAFYRIRSGSLGFSSDIIQDVYSLYASLVTEEQGLIAGALRKAMGNWVFDVDLKGLFIKPLDYITVKE